MSINFLLILIIYGTFIGTSVFKKKKKITNYLVLLVHIFKSCMNFKLLILSSSLFRQYIISTYLKTILLVILYWCRYLTCLQLVVWSGLLLLHTSDFSVNFSGSKARCRAKVLLRGRKNMWLGHHQRYVVPDRVPIHRRTRCHRAKPASTTSHSATTTIPYTQCGSETLKKCSLGKPQHYFPQFLAKNQCFLEKNDAKYNGSSSEF